MRCIAPLFVSCLLIALVGCNSPQAEPVTADAAGLTRLLDEDPERAAMRFREVVAAAGDTLVIDEAALNRLGYELLGQGRETQGVVVFELLTELLPDSPNAWDSLGEGYIHLLDRERAVAAYEKALELNPDNRNAQRQIDGIDRSIHEYANETDAAFAWEPGQQTGLQGPWLGQTPPGLVPEVFAPGLISTAEGFEFACAFSPDGREFYFNREFYISVCRLEEDGWTAPERAEFNNDNLNHEAHITCDGQRLFWGGRRSQEPDGPADYGIWFMDRQGDGWGEPHHHGGGMYVTTACSGNLYLTDIEDEAGGGLAVQLFQNGVYGPMQRLPEPLNRFRASHPCIAPDESWIVFDGYGPDALGGEGDDDFYVSFRDGDGWTEPVHLPDGISDFGSNMTASVSPDGKFLFFHGRRDIHWVSTEVLEQYRP